MIASSTRQPIVLLFVLLVVGCAEEKSTTEAPEAAVSRGKALADEMLIVDTHIDTPFRLYRNPEDVVAGTSGQFDYPRAIEGGLNVPFMSIYIPASVDEAGNAKQRADELIDLVLGFAEAHPDKFAVAYSTWHVKDQFRSGRVTLAMGMENGGPIEGDLENLEYFFDRGIRYITLAHSKSNHISDSSYDDDKRWGGLSDFGKELIPAMNDIGMMIDVSHVSDEAFYQVVELSETPVIASHSSARHFIPGFERNMSDDMLVQLAENGGVMQLNIGSTFISQQSRESSDARREAVRAHLEEKGIDPESDEAEAAAGEILANIPFEYADMDDVLDHVDHVVEVAGIDHIGVGSDFDGVGDTLPAGFKDVSDYPNFIEGLLDRGYSEADIEKILGGNLMRVWSQVEYFAESKKPKKIIR